jgi:hypothetical protein
MLNTYRPLTYANTDSSPSGYSAGPMGYIESRFYRAPWNEPEMPFSIQHDAETLLRTLEPLMLPAGASLADEVFGNQVQQKRFALEHTAHVPISRVVPHGAFSPPVPLALFRERYGESFAAASSRLKPVLPSSRKVSSALPGPSKRAAPQFSAWSSRRAVLPARVTLRLLMM